MAAFEPCFAPPPPAGVAASARYDAGGGDDDLSSNLSNDLSRTMDGTLGGSAMSAGFRTARAGPDTAEFGRALASPEKPGYSSALSPPMSPEHVKAEHDVLAALTLEAEIDADADADAARSRDGASDETNERFAAWAATGIVGMRGCARREVASRAFDLGGKVRVLDYGANRLETVSPRISELSNVARIVLRDNALRSMPWSAIASLTRLTHLDLSGNAALGNDVATATPTCASLETLSLARCDIAGEVCDDFFRGLPRLKHVSLVANRLERLPAFETNGLLEVVDASRNAVVSIPASYGALACLRSLNLVGNRIELEGIPVELLKHAKALVELNLRENPILVEALRERDGWSEFEARRKRRADKALDSRVMLGDNVFDEGADNDRFVRH